MSVSSLGWLGWNKHWHKLKAFLSKTNEVKWRLPLRQWFPKWGPGPPGGSSEVLQGSPQMLLTPQTHYANTRFSGVTRRSFLKYSRKTGHAQTWPSKPDPPGGRRGNQWLSERLNPRQGTPMHWNWDSFRDIGSCAWSQRGRLTAVEGTRDRTECIRGLACS